MKKVKKLKHLIISSWLIAGSTALVAILLLFSILGYYSYNQSLSLIQNELNDHVISVARKISGELLLEDKGSPTSVASLLKKELNLSTLDYGSKEYLNNLSKDKNLIYASKEVPFLENSYSVLISHTKPNILKHLNLSFFIFSVCIIGFIVGIGLFLQTRFLRKHLIRPIESLVDISTGDKVACENWPYELQEISNKLSSSFQQREQVVYNQIARGVIHDIKTILQSFRMATDLASESRTEKSLLNLLKVSSSKLPSLLEIIDTALDGSREITVSKQFVDINQTLQKAIDTAKNSTGSVETNIKVSSFPDNLLIPHDPLQLERVFTNLLKNSLESIAEDSAQSEKLIKVSFSMKNNDFISIQLEDSGVGLPHKPESVFRMLKSTKSHGSGLGLKVSKKIVEAHKGTITASHSVDLKGAKFEIILPTENAL